MDRRLVIVVLILPLLGGCAHDAPPADNTVTTASTPRDPLTLGKELYTRMACVGCHSLDGTQRVGPSFLDLYRTTARRENGATATRDEADLRDAILAPENHRTEGFRAQMPSYTGKLSDAEVDALVAMIKATTTSAK